MSGSHPWGQALLNSVELLGDRRRRQVWQKIRLAINERGGKPFAQSKLESFGGRPCGNPSPQRPRLLIYERAPLRW